MSPLVGTPLLKARRSIPKHWSPEQARAFLGLMEGDRTWPLWAFLLGSGLRIGELVWVEFATTLGYDVVRSDGKSRDSGRAIDLDPGSTQRKLQTAERLAASTYEETGHVFAKPTGGRYHPQLSRMLGRYTEELGLPRLTALGLRHTCATLMLAIDVPAKVAAEGLGHADATLFTNLYSHVTPTMQEDAAARIGSPLFGPEADDG